MKMWVTELTTENTYYYCYYIHLVNLIFCKDLCATLILFVNIVWI